MELKGIQLFLHSCCTYPLRFSQAFHISACFVSGASLNLTSEPLGLADTNKKSEIRSDVLLAGVSSSLYPRPFTRRAAPTVHLAAETGIAPQWSCLEMQSIQ